MREPRQPELEFKFASKGAQQGGRLTNKVATLGQSALLALEETATQVPAEEPKAIARKSSSSSFSMCVLLMNSTHRAFMFKVTLSLTK